MRRPAGLLLDLDGTLSEMVQNPEDSTISPSMRKTLQDLISKLDLVAVITGRSIAQARRIVAVDDLVYVGNHGLERWDGRATSIAPEAKPHLQMLFEFMEGLQERVTAAGVYFENKDSSFAVHYRNAQSPALAFDQIMGGIADLGSKKVKLVSGKLVINVLPPVELSKGTAVDTLVEEYSLASGIYIGDDVTDLDAFRAIGQLMQGGDFQGMRIAVVGPESPEDVRNEADYILSGVKEVGWFLDRLATRTG